MYFKHTLNFNLCNSNQYLINLLKFVIYQEFFRGDNTIWNMFFKFTAKILMNNQMFILKKKKQQ